MFGRDGEVRKMQVDRYASNITAKIFEFLMFIFFKEMVLTERTMGEDDESVWPSNKP